MTAVSLVVLTGWGGHISLGQFAIVGVGALVAGNLHRRPQRRPASSCSSRPAPPARLVSLARRPARAAHQGAVPRGHHAGVRRRPRHVRSSTSTTSRRSCPAASERPLLWERFDLDDGYNMYLVVPGLPRPVDPRRPGRAQGPGRPRDHRHPRQRAGRRRRRGADHQREARRLPPRRRHRRHRRRPHVLLLTSVESGQLPARPTRIDVFATAVIGGLGSVAGAVIGVLLFRTSRRSPALGDIRPAAHRRRAARRAATSSPAASASCSTTSATASCAGSPTGATSSCRAWWPTSATRRGRSTPRTRSASLPSALGSDPIASRGGEPMSRAERADDGPARRHRPRRPPRRPTGPAPARCRGIDMAYGPVQILFDVDFDVARGRDRRPARHQRRRQVHPAQGHLRPGAPDGRHGHVQRRGRHQACRPTSPPTGASR